LTVVEPFEFVPLLMDVTELFRLLARLPFSFEKLSLLDIGIFFYSNLVP